MKILTIIIPVYGKDEELVFNNLKDITSNVNDEIEFVIVYKNSEIFNYDSILSIAENRKNIIIKKLPESVKRTSKVLEAIKLSNNSKYTFVLDSHHSLDHKGINKLLRFLKKEKSDIVFTIPIEYNVDTKTSDRNKIMATTAGRYIFKTEKLINNIEKINFDVIFHDDWTCGLYTIFKKEPIKSTWYKRKFYIKNFGNNLSNTFKNKNVENINRMIIDSNIIILSLKKDKDFNEIYNLNETFRTQFNSLFFCILRRKSWLIPKGNKKYTISNLYKWIIEALDIDSYDELIYFLDKLRLNTELSKENQIKLISQFKLDKLLNVSEKHIDLINELIMKKGEKND